MPSPSFSDMRRRNTLKIVATVRGTPQVSRADVARLTNLARATVSSIVDELIGIGLLVESGSKQSAKGRRPIGLTFNNEASFCAGVSVEHSRINLVICDLEGVSRIERRITIPPDLDVSALSDTIGDAITTALSEADIAQSRLGSIGLAVPARLSSDRPVADSSVVPIDFMEVAKKLQTSLSCEIVLDSHLNMFAIAQTHKKCLPDEAETILIVRAGSSVHSALLLNGKLFEGRKRRAGQLGHIKVPGLGGQCYCGGNGCIETIASDMAIVASCAASTPDIRSLEDVIQRASAGDPTCASTLRRAAYALAFGVATAINLLAPDMVIVAGASLVDHQPTRTELGDAIESLALPEILSHCQIVIGNGDPQAEAFGAALNAVAIHNLLPGALPTV